VVVRVYIEEAGCDRRRLDAESIRSYLTANGYALVGDPARADKILAVTCAFKQDEENESVRRLRSLRKYGRDIVVYGCLADIAGERYTEFRDLPSVSPHNIDVIEQHFQPVGVAFADIPAANVLVRRRTDVTRVRRMVEAGTVPLQRAIDRAARLFAGSAIAGFSSHDGSFNLFVCRGCQGSCSYCAIRRAIGPVRSKPVEKVTEELLRGLDSGYRTFSILGDDPGCYGADLSSSLPELMGALFDTSESWTAAAEDRAVLGESIRFHIREIHPRHLVKQHEQLLQLPRFSSVAGILCPVQSGSDRILGLMQRHHTSSDLLLAIQHLRDQHPDLELSTQIIVGFPSETEDDLAQTLELVRAARFNSVVVFPYDDKQDAASSRLPGKIVDKEIRRRTRAAIRFFRRQGIPAYHSCP
jgi:tRNA A37 methylthiotransferase MiaB